ncbi:hypothetical protein KLMA_30702 [Kluyveromyces marxianus DMKU3-1042]|uniref:Uncharacterized protein n=1 Tax=Kluyveromyces marxianus (strain DMKU3-1042 / BCC 29191 / NBRC 104275) TaxID=1003335 RepID=W0T8P5_KLUMD|nr:hypothetical protein KLMA_30702 [Kluyveromyces marxianus DMKU3-1042]BAO39997.1 hypothetical protein KLMA_30702 [Kluyveromyces marxianus DMKU3-1042]
MDSIYSTFSSTSKSHFSTYNINELSSGFPSSAMMKQFYYKLDKVKEDRIVNDRSILSNLLKYNNRVCFISIPFSGIFCDSVEFLHSIFTTNVSYEDKWQNVFDDYDFSQLEDWIICIQANDSPELNEIHEWRKVIINSCQYYPICLPLTDSFKYSFSSDLGACSKFPKEFNYNHVSLASGCPTPLLLEVNDFEETRNCIQQIESQNLYLTTDDECNPIIAYTTGNSDIILSVDPSFIPLEELEHQHFKHPVVINANNTASSDLKNIIPHLKAISGIVGFEVSLNIKNIPTPNPASACSLNSSTQNSQHNSVVTPKLGKTKASNWMTSLFGIKQKNVTSVTADVDLDIENMKHFFDLLFTLLSSLTRTK